MGSWRDKLSENLTSVRRRIDQAARSAGRAADTVRLVAVTKQVAAAVARGLVELGVSDLGENRPQELWRKHDLVTGPVRWHLVGNLQKNKARRTLPLVHLIQSVDSTSLLKRLDDFAVEMDFRPDVLLEVNVSGESTKHGFRPDDLTRVIADSVELNRVRIRGLMTMAPYSEDRDRARPYFATLRDLRDRLTGQSAPNCRLTELSMGMSGDFEAAIAEGATIVRIGSALFEGIKEPA
jgi:pyridoxal phosphate enzyme (YggS family)